MLLGFFQQLYVLKSHLGLVNDDLQYFKIGLAQRFPIPFFTKKENAQHMVVFSFQRNQVCWVDPILQYGQWIGSGIFRIPGLKIVWSIRKKCLYIGKVTYLIIR